ncbi:zinc finger protein 469 [Dromiciops gliroides]|uniref:zinc finger protein 469 n=1 Tax=Dromiciops gliroides TaxID=33562 RepID=UPI001CC3C073|nr:zinc finger protein 469 [Dromiciops gliroides]XP_043841381.1 zinc finger protein 469 [Dromiciops gliroides]XP_043841382.1 zinc finger protein 469 [Dromiciops gliroides]
MKGETQHVYSIKDPEPSSKEQDKDFECHGSLEGGELNRSQSDGLPKATSPFSIKDKEPHGQREAVIRPQLAGKIDFKSLHNRPKLLSNGPWSAGKGTLQSPTGKSRVRDKTRRSGKGERGHQQLYRLTIANSRANPTIGIAYPQQKVTPPKKLEASKRPASGSYRFNVPSIPEREAELQQEEVSFNRYFQETPSSLIPTNYTSQAPTTTHPHHSRKDQQQVVPPQDSPSLGRPPHYLEFQVNRADSWPSPEKNFPGANYDITPTKSCPFPEGSKSSTHCFVPFQYPFQVSEPFPVEATSQEYVGASLAAHHGEFVFHSSSRDWQKDPLNKGSFDSLSQEGRAYSLPSHLAPFLHPQTQGALLPSPLPCYKGHGDPPPDLNGAISSSGANDQNPTPFLEGQGIFSTGLHGNMPKAVTKRQASEKHSVPSPRMPTPSNALRRNIPQNSLPQVHFPNKVFGGSPANSMSPASMHLDKDGSTVTEGHSKVAQPWDGGNKTFTRIDPNPAPYSTTTTTTAAAAAVAAAAPGVGNQFSFECQTSSEQRLHGQKGARVTWQQIHLTSAMPSPNRIEPLRQLSDQKVPFPPGTSEWQGVGKMPKTAHLSSPPGYPGKIQGAGEKRSEPIQLNGGLTGVYPYEGVNEASSPSCDVRTKPLFFGISQPQASPRRASKLSLALPPPGLAATSPGESPLPSPVPNPTSNSTCSSLSPLSNSPVNHSSEESQLSVPLAPSSYFQPPIHPKENNKTFHSADPSNNLSIPYQPETMKAFHFPADGPKDENLFKCLQESQFPRAVTDVSKGSLDSFDGELPPYSSHHFLANSISSASLDQLDVLLTCKQCDQNYSNLASFLEHRQYCSLHSAFLAEMRDGSRPAEGRKRPPEPLRAPQPGSGLPGPKGPSDPHSHLLGPNKPADFMLDGEGKGESKEDPLKGNFFTNSLSLMASDLEIEDAKLDSLITEALNGLEYQSDNPEIDSSFIDVFTDEELSATKGLGSGQSHKTKEGAGPEGKSKHMPQDGGQRPPPPTASHCEEGYLTRRRSQSRLVGQPPPEKEQTIKVRERGRGKRVSLYRKELTPSDPLGTGGNNKVGKASRGRPRRKFSKTSSTPTPTTRPSSRELRKQPRRSSPDSDPDGQAQHGTANTHPGPRSPKRHRFSKKEGKRRKAQNGTWSKELIHKIVQQKNKPHKLQVKNNRIMQLSLVTPKPVPVTKSGQFGEYDYISDSDEEGRECSLGALEKRQLENSNINGKPKHNFLRRNRGEKELGQKQEGKRYQDSQEDPSDETGNKKECVSLSPEVCQPSPGDDQSTKPASKIEKQHQSTEKRNSDNGKENEIRSPSDSIHTFPLPTGLPQLPSHEESPTENYPLLEDFAKKRKRPCLAKALSARTKLLPSSKSNFSLTNDVNENGSPMTEEKTMQSKESITSKPSQIGSNEKAASKSKMAGSHVDVVLREVSESPVPSTLQDTTHNIEPPFSPFSEDTLKYQTGELMNSSQVSTSMDISYREASLDYLKNHDPSEDPKDFAIPTGCYNGDAIGIMLSGKGHDSYESTTDETSPGQKDLSDHYDSNLYSKPLVLGPSHVENMYLSQEGTSSDVFEPGSSKIPSYTTESEPGKVSPPLSFDSSSIFSSLPVAGFDTPLYGGMSPSKVSYIPFACESTSPSKPTQLEQQYPPFLHEKDWTLEEVSPVLSDDMGHFHDLSVEKSLEKKFPDEGRVTPSQIPLPGKMGDYSVPFMNNMSEDELEIKRLVTELESELQTSKLDDVAPGVLQSPEHFIALDAPETAKPFSTSPLGQESEREKHLFLTHDLSNLEETSLMAPKSHSGPDPGKDKEEVASMDKDYGSHQGSWSCAISFEPLATSMSPNAHEHAVTIDPFGSPLTCDQLHLELQETEISKQASCSEIENESLVSDDPSFANVSEKLEPLASAESLTKSSPVRESTSSKNREVSKMTEQDPLQLLPRKTIEDVFPEPHEIAPTLSEPPELETFGNPVTHSKSEMGFRDDIVPVLNTTSSSDARNVNTSEENALKKANRAESPKSAVISHHSEEEPILEGNEEAVASVSHPSMPICEKTGNKKASLFEVLSLAKDPVCGGETALASQGSTANPLQELQLFVARTVQNNEEEKMPSCLTELLSASLQLPSTNPSDLKGENQEDEDMACDHNNDVRVMEGEQTPLTTTVGIQLFPETGGNLDSLSETESFLASQSKVGSPAAQNHVTQLQQSPESEDLHICPHDISQDTSPSPFSTTSDSPVAELMKREGQPNRELEQDHNIATWTFKRCQRSPLSPASLEKEELGDAIAETSGKDSAWGKEEKQLPSAEKSKRTPDKFPDELTLLPAYLPSPKNILEKNHWKNKTISVSFAQEASVSPRQCLQTPSSGEDSVLGLPLQATASVQEHLQGDGAESLLTTVDTQSENNEYGVLPHNPERKLTPLSLEKSIYDPEKSLECCSAQNPVEKNPGEVARSTQPVFENQSITVSLPQAAGGNDRCCLEDDILNSQVEPGEEDSRTSPAPFNLSHATLSPLRKNASQKAPTRDSTISYIPHLGQNDVVRKMPMKCACMELACPHHKESQPRSLSDVTLDVHSQEEGKSYPEGPTDSLISREAKVEQDPSSQQEGEARNNEEGTYSAAMGPKLTKMPDTNIGDPENVHLLTATEVSSFNSASPSVDPRKDSLRTNPSKSHRNDLPELSIGDMQNQLDPIQEKSRYKQKPPPLRNGQWKQSPPQPNELQVTCDICSLSFKSKPGLMRHKAVKHRIKNHGPSLPNKTTRSSSAPLEKGPKISRHHSKKSLRALTVKEKACDSFIHSSPTGPPLENEPNTQKHEEVNPGLSDLRAAALPLTHELLHSDLVNGKAKMQPEAPEPGKSAKLDRRKPSPKKLDRRRKGRKRQSKEPADLNSDSEGKLMTGVRKKQVKRFPRKNQCTKASESEKNILGVSADGSLDRPDSSSSSTIANYPGYPSSSLSTPGKDWAYSVQPALSATPVHETLKNLDEMGNQILFTEETCGQKTINDLMSSQGRMENLSTRDQIQVSEESWENNFLRPEEEGLCNTYNEMHEDTRGTNVEEYIMEKRKLEEGSLGKHDFLLKQAPLSPAKPDLPLGTSDAEKRKTITTNNLPQVFSEDTVMDSEAQNRNKGEQSKETFAKDQTKVDLQHLFDDDATFSLLFPRDDHFSRRKCTRVYGKGPKKPKPIIEASSQVVGSPEIFSIRLPSDLSDTDSFCVTQEDPCNYESMSFHDAFTLDMCHGNDTWSLSPGIGAQKPDGETDSDNKMGLNLEDDEMLTYLCPNNRLEAIPSLHISPAVWNDLEVLDHCNEMSFKSPLEAKNEYSLGEASPGPPELEVETYAGHIHRNPGSPELHPIDIELLSTKFEMRDMHFFSTCEDCSGQSDPSTLSFKKQVNEYIQPNKQKEEEGKRGRSRGDLIIKTREKHYKCKVCFQWFLTLGELDFHKLTHNPSPPPTCYMCVQRKFSSREQLKEHLKGKHAKNKVGLWACGMCLKEISDVWMYNEHLREHAAKFARKGQVQKCMTGLPTCFGEEDAVAQFLNTIMNRKPRPSRGKRSASKRSKDPKAQESKGSQDNMEDGGKNKPLAPTNTPSNSNFPAPSAASSSSSKVGSPDPGHSSEHPSKAVPMHPQCKDPSRDCHHCGKQFPKPFKLQRHLVVHSLEKIYMCTRCPKFYKETRELRGHLSQEHGVKEKPEIKHTTLYTCELCADVMHVIKKSFICSTCNYTFSKKEQYERHMEKHLAEGNRTFKFRGVMRPGAGAREGKEKKKKEVSSQESMPPNKKRKVALPNSLPGPDADGASDPLDHIVGTNPPLDDKPPPILYKPFLEEALSSPARSSTDEKPKDLMDCFSNHLDKMESCPLELLQLPPPCLSPLSDTPEECKEGNSTALLCVEDPKDDLPPTSPTPLLETSKLEQDLPILPIGRSKEFDENLALHLAPVQSKHTNTQDKPVVDADKELPDYPNSPGHTTTETPFVRTGKKIPTSHSNKTEAPWPKEPQKGPGSDLSGIPMSQKESSSKLGSPKTPHPAQPLKDRTASPILNRATKDSAPPPKTTVNHVPRETASSTPCTEDVPRPTTLKTKPNQSPRSKDSVGSSVKDGGSSQPKPTSAHLRSETAMISTKPDHKDLGISPDKPAMSISTKGFSKRQKEHRGLGHKGSLGSRENIKGDGKKKKVPETGRGEGPRDYKRAEWTTRNNNSLPSSRRRATQDNRISKPRPSGTSSQLKKTVPDPYNQKKVETHHHKRNAKCKKGILGKSFREVVPKGTPSSLHSTLKRNRTVQGAKPAETHKHRTVESQNNLLSQLFGQKLTSFKIPLRRDTSE